MAAKTVFLKHKLENRIMSLRGFRVFQGFPLAWGESPSPHLFDVGDKSFTPSLKPEESTDFTHYFADFVKKHLTPPMPLGLGMLPLHLLVIPSPNSPSLPFFACVEGRIYLCAGFLVDGAHGNKAYKEEEKKIELKEKLNCSTGVTEASAAL